MTHPTLLVLHKEVHPTDSGSKQRARLLLRAAARAGPVDVVVLTPALSDTARQGLLADGADRVASLPESLPETNWAGLRGTVLPRGLRNVPAPAAVRNWYEGLGWGLHDVRVYVEPRSWWAMRLVRASGPTVVDLENVMSTWAVRAARQKWDESAQNRTQARMRAAGYLLEAAAWRRVERMILHDAERVLVCSNLDLERLGHPKVAVVPNAYEAPSIGHLEPLRTGQHQPVVTMVGKLSYPPNLDAAKWLRNDIYPRLLNRRPGVTVRVVGRAPNEVQRLAAPGFEVLGFVPDISDLLAETDVCVVPIRFGGGTRIKILEAWAHGRPVVSTTIGAEGLNATDGHDILIADDAEGIAAAIDRVLTDPDLRDRLAHNGLHNFQEHFGAERVEQSAAELFAQCRSCAPVS